MKTKPPPDRRRFATAWDEIGYLYDKLLYWLYQREDSARARAYATRLERLVSRADPRQEAIFGQECSSLVCEALGDHGKAIEHRENEIRLIRKLHAVSRDIRSHESSLKAYSWVDLSDRLDLLAILYHDSGALQKAIATLRESKQLCTSHGLRFDGDDILQEYLEELHAGTLAGNSSSA